MMTPDHIFFLRHNEALRLFREDDSAVLLMHLQRNRRFHRSFRNYVKPNEIRPEGRSSASIPTSATGSGATLRSVACSWMDIELHSIADPCLFFDCLMVNQTERRGQV
ncbi:hypothetical protein CCP3SC1_520020 [Gammaproteobacteria bacterium]